MGLLDGTLQQKIQRLEKLTSPSQYPKPSQDAIDKLRNIMTPLYLGIETNKINKFPN